MMQMTVLASGSKGNSTVISSGRTRIMVDAGLSCRELMRRMAEAGEDASTLDAILITHEHIDHVAGLGVLARKLKIPVFITEPTHKAWVRMFSPRSTMSYAKWLEQIQREKEVRADTVAAEYDPGTDAVSVAHLAMVASEPHSALNQSVSAKTGLNPSDDGCSIIQRSARKTDPTCLPAVEHFCAGVDFSIGDIAITPFTIPHDAVDPCGFVFESGGVRMALATDLGYMPPNVKAALRRVDLMLLESNHDLEMLRDGPYPWSVKQRVMSRVGHLSNHAMAEFLENDYDGSAEYIVLGHLSESNNAPELARMSAEQALGRKASLLGNKLLLATQASHLESITL
ncbi:hypothetical protein GCM10011507_27630 [Edaphobacter acidisoli]|uniref:Metallo-beta-lactamase domain-containing protein n=1 Tax=Edaphobacter acidisoli TaxID=2040573 RepID=A0A916RZ73_9BACT|nr:MBL fold metallo-hydrolase [Edaphobacter acidisoli]GGA74698.1 hypothetical protein GCM10011507_27630 [Edaphobacter acidisoli]